MSTIAVTTVTTGNGTTDATVSTGNTSAGRFVVQSGGGLFLASNSSQNTIVANTTTVSFLTSGTERLRVDSNGNTGIGTTSPPAKLTSNGTIRSTSTGASGYVDIRHDGTNGVLVANTGSLLMYAEGLNSIIMHTNATQRFSIGSDGSFTSVIPSGSTLYPAYMCRAWVNFNGTGTVAIRGSGNVTSITDNAVGDYTVNFTTAMPDANYSVTGVAQRNATNSGMFLGIKQGTTPSTTQCVIATPNNAGTLEDSPQACVAFFR